MKRVISFIIVLIFISSFAACRGEHTAEAGHTEQPQAAVSEKPTEQPTQAPEPTTEPTPEPAPLPTEAPLPEDPADYGDCIRDAEVLFFAPFGDGEECVGFKQGDELSDPFDGGPNSFCVSDGRIFVLDSVNKRVIVYDNGETSYILVDGLSYYDLETFTVIGDTMYFSGSEYESKRIFAFDMSGRQLESIPVPDLGHDIEDILFIHALFERDGKLAFLNDELRLFVYADGEWTEECDFEVDPIIYPKTTWTFFGHTVNVDTGVNTLPGVRWYDENRVYVKVLGFFGSAEEGEGFKSENLLDVFSFAIFDSYGRVIGCSYYDTENAKYYPEESVFVSPEGEMYLMLCEEEGVYITKPNLRRRYVDRLMEQRSVLGIEVASLPADGEYGPQTFAVADGGIYFSNSAMNGVAFCGMGGTAQRTVVSGGPELDLTGATHLFIGAERIYVIAAGKLYAFEKETGELMAAVTLPKTRQREYELDDGPWYEEEGFAASIVFISETDGRLCLTVRENVQVMSAYVVDLDNATIEKTRDRGVSASYNRPVHDGDDDYNTPWFAFEDLDAHHMWEFRIGDRSFKRLLGYLTAPIQPVVEAYETDEQGNTVRKVLIYSKAGELILESADITDENVLCFTFGDDGNVYALVSEGSAVNVVLVDLY
ncbi:MAG: hypothetical protein J5772_08880 [Clostridia bacterium]|nr:hypothetical protein [Clostridia bacterium]